MRLGERIEAINAIGVKNRSCLSSRNFVVNPSRFGWGDRSRIVKGKMSSKSRVDVVLGRTAVVGLEPLIVPKGLPTTTSYKSTPSLATSVVFRKK